MAQTEPTPVTPTTPAPAEAALTPPGVPTAEAPPAGGSAAEPAGGAVKDVLDTDAAPAADSSATKDVLADADASGDEGVPDQYTFDLTDEMKNDLKGKGVSFSEEALGAFKDTAKEMGLSQNQFKQIIEYDIQRQQAAVTEAVDAWNTRVDGWREAARSDKDFGGKDYDANVKAVLGIVEKFADADFKAMIKSPTTENPDGLAIGNNPAFLRTMNRIAKALGDPSLILGDDVQKDDTNEAKLRRMYPSMYKESA